MVAAGQEVSEGVLAAVAPAMRSEEAGRSTSGGDGSGGGWGTALVDEDKADSVVQDTRERGVVDFFFPLDSCWVS